MSRTGIIVPIRSLHDGKTRLAPVLQPDEREMLNRSMFARVLGEVGELPGLLLRRSTNAADHALQEPVQPATLQLLESSSQVHQHPLGRR